MGKTLRWLLWITLLFLWAGFQSGHAAAGSMRKLALQGTTLAMVSPSACPAGGCAAGQRMNLLSLMMQSYGYFDPEQPHSVEIHFRFWNPEVEGFAVEGTEGFWMRRTVLILFHIYMLSKP